MVVLTFAEQVKLVLSRRNMTIKQLAEEIQEATGMKMSRQNLTQRLSRDNFQEKDMRMIAEILGCKLYLTILDDTVEQAEENLVDEIVEELVEEELLEEAIEEELAQETEEVVEIEEVEAVEEVEVVEEVEEIEEIEEVEAVEEVQETEELIQELMEEFVEEEKESAAPQKENLGEINPYTLREYDNNTVRTHPKRIGYVQVYDREQHGWTEMTEWAYLGYQERQRRMLGKNYQEPIFLD